MSKYIINVDEGSDTASYHTDEPPTYKAVFVPVEDQENSVAEPSRIVFCMFVPKNGHNRGKLLAVTFSRIISIAEEKP